MTDLYDTLHVKPFSSMIAKIKKSYLTAVPFHISGLRSDFILRPYQIDSMSGFDFVFQQREDFFGENENPSLLFNLATGSGKTLLMASNILYLYEKGYRTFIFFVNSDAVVRKTRDNFVDPGSDKYLFADPVVFQGNKIAIREIPTPDEAAPDAINILLTTIQGLHVRLNNPSENSITFESLSHRRIVLLSDEAHHINATTRGGNGANEENKTWEDTVSSLLAINRENILLEYTATVEWENEEISNKYQDKVLSRYDLKAFREDGYCKDVYLLKSQDDQKGRLLKALVVSYYREMVAQHYGISLKPLILVKSAKIKDSESDHNRFHELVRHVGASDIRQLRISDHPTSRNIISSALEFFKRQGISDADIAHALKENFRETRLVNSKADQTAMLSGELHNLEKSDNPIRVIFVVDMLNEGWDVLNLYDIVRLDESNRTDAKIRTKDVQLIGRGARYYPFLHESVESDDPEIAFKRKFDDQLNHDLRALEELHYHTMNNNRFIENLTKALVDSGLKDESEVEQRYSIKPSLKETPFWRQGRLFYNERMRKGVLPNETLASYEVPAILPLELPLALTQQQNALVSGTKTPARPSTTYTLPLNDLGPATLMSAMSNPECRFFRFDNLRDYLPKMKTRLSFITDHLSALQFSVSAPDGFHLSDLLPGQRKTLAMRALARIASHMRSNRCEYTGSRTFSNKDVPIMIPDVPVVRKFRPSQDPAGIGRSIQAAPPDVVVFPANEDWYLFDDNHGTIEEKRLIRLIRDHKAELNVLYEQFVLVRNEKYLALHAFSDGERFEPDFILWAKHRDPPNAYLQAFIEPKGQHLFEADKWKEDFLLEIDGEKKVVDLFEQAGYRILGLPFYNHEFNDKNVLFTTAFRNKVLGRKG